MKRIFFALAAIAPAFAVAAGETPQQLQFDADSLEIHEIQKIEVTATRAGRNTPVAYENLSRGQIEQNNFGLDIPSLLSMTPSLVATNETGIGIGGTSLRLRGTDATRINVTINGVSMNNPDSHAMYWYDTPDLVSAVGDIQVQRGAGLSTNGTGAFGGAVNMTTSSLSPEFGGSASLTYGSYNTNKQAVQIGSGLLNNHWMVDARLTHIGSDGYIDRGSTDLKSYMLQGAYYNGGTMVKLVSFGGKAKTYLTYDGVTKEDMELYGRRYQTGGQYETSSGPYVLADGTHVNYYDDQTDNYLQINNQLIVSHKFDDRWSLNLTGFYTYGYGYYRQYKARRTLSEYGLDIAGKADIIRDKIMRNHLGGLNAAALYTIDNFNLAFGGSYSYYTCPHWGELHWVDGLEEKDYADVRWYDNKADKHDANLYAKADWQVAKGLHLFADMQYRLVKYTSSGVNDNYDWTIGAMQPINIDKNYNFFNPHIGVNYRLGDRHDFFASFAIANKEPTRGDFTDRYLYADDQTEPVAERMYDYEIGYRYVAPRLSLGVNLYYMVYENQLVKTGQINNSYDALNINVPDSYRRGIELTAAWSAAKWLTVGANATFSQNRIKNYLDKVVDYALEGNVAGEYGYLETQMGETCISYSPGFTGSLFLDFHIAGFDAVWHTQYVGEQYFCNFRNADMKLDAYCVTNLNLGYTLRTKAVRSVRFGVQIYNLFNSEYCSNGYGWSEAYDGERTDHAFYFPQAPLHALANVTLSF